MDTLLEIMRKGNADNLIIDTHRSRRRATDMKAQVGLDTILMITGELIKQLTHERTNWARGINLSMTSLLKPKITDRLWCIGKEEKHKWMTGGELSYCTLDEGLSVVIATSNDRNSGVIGKHQQWALDARKPAQTVKSDCFRQGRQCKRGNERVASSEQRATFEG